MGGHQRRDVCSYDTLTYLFDTPSGPTTGHRAGFAGTSNRSILVAEPALVRLVATERRLARDVLL